MSKLSDVFVINEGEWHQGLDETETAKFLSQIISKKIRAHVDEKGILWVWGEKLGYGDEWVRADMA